MTKLVLAVVATVAAMVAGENLTAFGHTWSVPHAADWQVENIEGVPTLRMLVARPQEKPRRPLQFALAQTPDWRTVRLEAEVQRLGGSLILVYAWRDEAHFNYAHLSVDTGVKQPVHNGIFHVYGGDRVRISPTTGEATLPATDRWYRVQLDYDSETGEVVVLVDGKKNPSLRGIDLSLGAGKVGIGSFFEKALFRNVKITGKPAS